VFFVKKRTFPQRRVHYVQYQYFLFYILLIWGVRTHPTHPPAYGPEDTQTEDGNQSDTLVSVGRPFVHPSVCLPVSPTVLRSLQTSHVHGPSLRALSTGKKGKGSPYSITSVGFRSGSRFLAVSLQVTWVINPAVGCHYFPPGPQLPSQPLRWLPPVSLLGEQRHDGCEQFA